MCTVGQLSVWPGASNVIAGLVNFTVDLRSRQNAIRSGACAAKWTLDLRALSPPAPPAVIVAETRAAIQEICARRNISCTIEQRVRLDRGCAAFAPG